MHEMSLTESLLRLIEEQAATQRFDRVRTVRLEIGLLSHADPEAIAFCFAAASRGTRAQGARLEILRSPGRAWCMACARTVPLAERYDPCPDCGGHQLQVAEGDGLRLRELEVE